MGLGREVLLRLSDAGSLQNAPAILRIDLVVLDFAIPALNRAHQLLCYPPSTSCPLDDHRTALLKCYCKTHNRTPQLDEPPLPNRRRPTDPAPRVGTVAAVIAKVMSVPAAAQDRSSSSDDLPAIA
jgi:hypothetical protein